MTDDQKAPEAKPQPEKPKTGRKPKTKPRSVIEILRERGVQ